MTHIKKRFQFYFTLIQVDYRMAKTLFAFCQVTGCAFVKMMGESNGVESRSKNAQGSSLMVKR